LSRIEFRLWLFFTKANVLADGGIETHSPDSGRVMGCPEITGARPTPGMNAFNSTAGRSFATYTKNPLLTNLTVADNTSIHDKFYQEEKRLRYALGGARRTKKLDSLTVRCMPLGKVPAIRRTIHPFAASSNGWAVAFARS